MKSFAIIRHAPIKHGRHLVATGLHNARGIPTPNADRKAKAAVPVELLIGTKKPWKDVARVLDSLKIEKIKSDGNSAIEVFCGASPEWWQAQGWAPGINPTDETRAALRRWVDANMTYARERFGPHLIASAALHLDEASPHIHFLVVPAQYRADGRERGEKKGRLASRTGDVLPPATIAAPRPSSPPLLSLPPSSSGCDQRVLTLGPRTRTTIAPISAATSRKAFRL